MEPIKLVAVGDVFLNRADPDEAFAYVAPLLQAADITFGNSEGTYAEVSKADEGQLAAILASPSNVRALARSGFDVMSVANNHINDWGRAGMHSTLSALDRAGIRVVGYGKDVDAAFAPTFLEVRGKKIAFVAATAIGSRRAAATNEQDGIAMLEIETEHIDLHDQPGSPPQVRSRLTPRTIARVIACVEDAVRKADFVIATFHWGVHLFPATIAAYERELARLAIDHGADAVLGHHQHILKGADFYKGRPILHGMGNFTFDLPGIEEICSQQSLREVIEIYGEYGLFTREGYPTLPFHEESRMTVLVHLELVDGAPPRVTLTPCVVNGRGQPVPIATSDASATEKFIAYLRRINWLAGIEAAYSLEDGRITVLPV